METITILGGVLILESIIFVIVLTYFMNRTTELDRLRRENEKLREENHHMWHLLHMDIIPVEGVKEPDDIIIEDGI